MKRKIMHTMLTGIFLFGLTITSNNYTKAAENLPVTNTQKEIQLSIIPEEISENIIEYTQPVEETENISDEEFQSEQDGVSDNVSTTESQTESDTETDTVQKSISGICEKDGNVDNHWVLEINSQLSMIPQSLITAFQNDGWHIYCTDMNIDAVYYNSQFGAVMGTTNYDEKRILLEDRNDAVYTATIHEFGHWLDWHNGMVTDSSEFDTIYNNETAAFKSAFQVNFYYDKRELFAEGFWKYITDGQTLANNCPQLYNFISQYV